jgi:hypothetical protein
MGQSTWRCEGLDADEEWEQFQVTWAGMPDIMVAYLNAVAGAADIPMTRLLGNRPRACSRTATASSATISRWSARARTSCWRRRSTASTSC